MDITFDEFANALVFAAQTLRANIKEVGEAIAKDLEAAAKAKFGVYQEGWAPLSEFTVAERIAKGFSPNDPLLRTGELRDSVGTKVKREGFGVVIELFSTDPRMAWQELGTSTIPPRPVLMPTVLERGPLYAEMTGLAAVASVLPAKVQYLAGDFTKFSKKMKLVKR